MPLNITENTPRTPATISGQTVQMPQPFEVGYTLATNGEAGAMNQLLTENTRNNLAKRIKEAPDEAQSLVDEYLAIYEFGVRRMSSGGDPIEREALRVAKEKVREALKNAGHVLKDVPPEKINELATGVLAKYPQIREVAAATVKSREALDIGAI